MKKLIFILLAGLAFMFTGYKAEAQGKLTRAVDTIANTTTRYNTSPALGKWQNISLQWTGTKQSGTVTYVALLEGTIDGTNWKAIPGTDSLSTTNGTGAITKIWSVERSATVPMYTKVRVTIIPSSGTFTQSGWFNKD